MFKEGYLASGVAAVLCARHMFVRPRGVCDLQKGERYTDSDHGTGILMTARYANIDYLFLTQLLGILTMWLIITYDIACQWSLNFFT